MCTVPARRSRGSDQQPSPPPPHLTQRLIEFLQDALLVKHLALVPVLVVVVDLLPEVRWQLVEGHVLLHLFVLRGQRAEVRGES